MTKILIRPAELADAPAILAVYAPYVRDTSISFETEVPSLEEFTQRMNSILGEYPYLIAEVDGNVAGYAYSHRHMDRAAYQWNAEFSIYLAPAYIRQGLGRKLHTALEEISKLQGLHNIYSGVTLPNPGSEGLQKSLGFIRYGLMEKTGHKFGKWLDVARYHKRIAPADPEPTPPLPYDKLPADKVRQILEACALV